ncbi:MAG TPA: alpha,alpha-trehalase TreA [Chryseolinea sp.]|nr:alpha,alpha-trehalase TreA [Chryseolinea sp.]
MNKQDVHTLGPLFQDVQQKNVLGDGKTFPDCIPKNDLKIIAQLYQSRKYQADFDLHKFVLENFELPPDGSTGYKSDGNKPITKHIEELWNVLTRQPAKEKSSLIPLPNPYVVPGGRFREIYYWDSYFTMLGLRISKRTDLIQHMVENFSYLIDHVGYIPNGNRSYFLGRSQPPFYSLMVRLLAIEKGNDVLLRYLPRLVREYQFWMAGSKVLSPAMRAVHHTVLMPDGSILNRYWDEFNTPRPEAYREDVELSHQSKQKPEDLYRNLRAAAESGWDFSSRWFKDDSSFDTIHTTDIVPVDLNCLLFHLEKLIGEAYELNGDEEMANRFHALSRKRHAAIQLYCWSESRKFYFDFDFRETKQKQHFTLAGVFPLFFDIATTAQASAVGSVLKDKFLKPGGLVTTLNFTGQQWDAPNGWAPLQWIAYRGLMNHDLTDLAQQVQARWMKVNENVYQSSGKMTEKYDVCNEDGVASGGEYPNQDGFGWTNGVYLAMEHERS